jgi:hypothetical protein
VQELPMLLRPGSVGDGGAEEPGEHEQLSVGTAGRGRDVDGLGATRSWARALGWRSAGVLKKDWTRLAQQESIGTSMAKERDMEGKASKHASKCEHACARARVCVCERVRVRARAA